MPAFTCLPHWLQALPLGNTFRLALFLSEEQKARETSIWKEADVTNLRTQHDSVCASGWVLLFPRVAGEPLPPPRRWISCVCIITSTFHPVNTASSHSSPTVSRRRLLVKPDGTKTTTYPLTVFHRAATTLTRRRLDWQHFLLQAVIVLYIRKVSSNSNNNSNRNNNSNSNNIATWQHYQPLMGIQ